MKALMLTLLFLLTAANEAKEYSKCELASLLKQSGMDGYNGFSLADCYPYQGSDLWMLKHPLKGVCMAFHESSFNTGKVGRPNRNGSRDYGIFQINSRWWCNNYRGRTANGCNKLCSAFTDDDITDDIVCAKRIVRDPQKMNAWVAWKNNCKDRNLSKWTWGCNL